MTDLTIIYSTAHKIEPMFAGRVRANLEFAARDNPIEEIHSTPEESSITNYYLELLGTARAITSPYIAFAEDDTLYPDEHFNERPSNLKTFAYNYTRWNFYTWSKPPFYSLRQRSILATLIAPREEFIKVMEKRLQNPDESQMIEPGRGVGELHETFETYNPIVVFTHPNAFGYMDGKKLASKIRALSIPYWNEADRLKEKYYDIHPGA